MHWTRGQLVVGVPGMLGNDPPVPVDVALRGRRCVLEYLGRDFSDAGGGRQRLIRMRGQVREDGRWLLQRRADHSALELELSVDRRILAGGYAGPYGRQSWRIVLEQPLPAPLSMRSATSQARRGRGRGRGAFRRPALATCHYRLVAGQWRHGETRQRDALLLAGKVWQHARMGLRRIEVFAAEVLVGLATGLPGHPAAPAASRIVLDALRGLLIERPELRTDGRPGHRLMVEVQRELQRRLGRRPHGRGAGASLVLAHLRGASLLVLAVGTCRAVLLGADGTVSALGEAQDLRMLHRGSRQAPPPAGYPPSYRHPAQMLSADGDSDLLAVQRLRRKLVPGDTVLLLSPGAVERLVGPGCHDDAVLLMSLRSTLAGARTWPACAARLGRQLRSGGTASGCASFLLLDHGGDGLGTWR